MNDASVGSGTHDVPAQVFEQFLADLAESGMPADVIARLRKALITDRSFSERSLNTAVFAEEPLP